MVDVPAAIPVTTPPDTVAFALLLLQVPPALASVNIIADPAHTLEPPVIVPATGSGFIVIVFVATAVPHEFVVLYFIVSVPAETPVTIPPPVTEALVLLALHTPPAVASVTGIVDPAHTDELPVTVPANGNGFIVIVFVAVAVPQVTVTV